MGVADPTAGVKVAAKSPAAATEPRYFATPAAFRRWFSQHATTAGELVVGFKKRHTGAPSITWPEAVDEALCVGWIDGVRHRIDDEHYKIRFTPRKAGSTWSAVNIARMAVLEAEGRVQAAGRAAFEQRSEARSRTYAYEQKDAATLAPAELRQFKQQKAAWAWFEQQAPSYRHKLLWWVVNAKQAATRERRLALLIESAVAGKRLTASAPTARSGSPPAEAAEAVDLATVLAWLKAASSPAALAGLARYAIPSEHAFGVAMRDVQAVAKRIGRRHDLAFELWDSGWYEARLLCAYIADPSQLTVAQMDRWCRGFDNWAVCDTLCFALFDRTPLAWGRVKAWAASPHEYVKRGAFALLWGLTVHDKQAADAVFLQALGWVEKAAFDERHFVKKAVNMALRATGKRNAALKVAARAVAERLASSDDDAARWVGRDALRELGGGATNKATKKATKTATKKERHAK